MSDGVWAAVYLGGDREAHLILDGVARCGLESLWMPALMPDDGPSEWQPCPICLDTKEEDE